jgi:hypothetical protein
MRLEQVKMPQGIFTKIQLFCLYKFSSNSCKPLVNFQSSEKVEFDYFCQRSHGFCGEVDFRSHFLPFQNGTLLSIMWHISTYIHTYICVCVCVYMNKQK